MIFFIAGILLALAHSVYSTDYCATGCGTNHVGCNAKNQMGADCSNDASNYAFNAQEKQLILDMHNGYRNAICNGSIYGYAPCAVHCARMAKMSWDEELANLGVLNTQSCQFKFDNCRNTDKFKAAGQNVAGIGSSGAYPSAADAIRGVVNTFWGQRVNANMSDIPSFKDNGRGITLFTQLLWSNATAIGCGATRFKKDNAYWSFFTCNYAAGNVPNYPVYEPSQVGGSGCKTGTDATFKALCSTNEPLDPNYQPATTGSASPPDTSNFSKNFCATNCGTSHVACNKADTLSSSCSSDASIYRFNNQYIEQILSLHNGYRNGICNGSVSGFPPCARSAVVTWDPELAYLAGLTTRGCSLTYDSCRNTDTFPSVGQLVAAIATGGAYPSPDLAIKSTVDSFYNKYKNANMSDIQSFSNNGKDITSFTQLMQMNLTRIGCGATKYSSNYNWFLMACNFAIGNTPGSPVYTSSATGGSGCTTGVDSTYPALCSNKENIDPYYKPSAPTSTTSNSTTGSNGSTGSNITTSVNSPFSSNDYCNISSDHVACNRNATLYPTCPKGSSIHPFNQSEIDLILDRHNDWRNAFANGSMPGFNPSSKMAKMVWDPELAWLAIINTCSCVFAHDKCRSTNKFKYAGQNLGQISQSGDQFPDIVPTIKGIIDSWYSEHKWANMSDINSFSRLYVDDAHTKAIGHFTAAAWSSATKVGCGMSMYPKDGWNNNLMACNIATTNMGGKQVYPSGKPASGCTTGPDSKYNALCTINEPIDPNVFYP